MKLSEISNLVGGLLRGEGGIDISGVAPLESAGSGEISFLSHSRYQPLLATTKASALMLPEGDWQLKIPHILCKNPYLAFAQVMQKFYPAAPGGGSAGVHPTAVIAEGVTLGREVSVAAHVTIDAGVRIGDRTKIWPGCFIGRDSLIGDEVIIYPNVSVREETEIGSRVIIHSGAVIGSDGFGFAEEEGRFHKIPQVGRVIIEDDVEIGANCCIDRATLGETRIHRGVKLDNLIQIAHNAEIGEHSAVAAQSGISGSCKLGKYVRLGGQVGLVGHITIGDHVICGAQAGVTKSLPEKIVVSGYPARNHKKQLRIEASQTRLPEMIKKIAMLEQKIDQVLNSAKSPNPDQIDTK